MTASAGWPAPAKLNLFLNIIGRRADGYHLLQTVFQFLDHGDRLDYEVRSDGVVRRVSELAGVAAEDDLVVRAARALQAETGTRLGADIRVDKRLPLGGGLGGGSSDAATTLVALNRLWGTGLDEDSLAELGLRLGADVPVFVRGRAAWAEGVGELLEAIALPEPWYVVLVPPVTVSTAEIFSAPQLIRDGHPITIRDFLRGQGDNVCEAVVRRRYPPVDAAMRALDAVFSEVLGADAPHGGARLTGTGACVFAACDEERDARAAWERLRGDWAGFVARGLNRSPLARRLAAELGRD
ncbi:MAG TPA: 4-(cytidine 5'-diphospho)-2-C-methyl-D-erythritol kinase [Gammaproteobacteria bacterium]|nr:4-(cytidine 5'-diphospho)-2-C-methyl-D-erythritol kinase [Gammaproteobacteria bacterium]